MRSKYFAIGFVAGVLAMLLWPGEETTNFRPIETRIVSRVDTIRVETIKTDSTTADSLRMEISKLQEKLLAIDKPKVIIMDRIITDTVFVDHYIQYVSKESIRLPYVRGEISAYALAPVDSFAYSLNVDFGRWEYDNNVKPVFGLQKQTWYGIGTGIVIGIVGWELIR